jgi:hypothetical protein
MQVASIVDADSVDALKGVAFQVQLQVGTDRNFAPFLGHLMAQLGLKSQVMSMLRWGQWRAEARRLALAVVERQTAATGSVRV